MEDVSGNLHADSHGIFSRCKNYFCQLLNIHWVNSIRQSEIQKGEPFVPERRFSEVEIAIGKLKKCKSKSLHQQLPDYCQHCICLV